MYESLLYLVCRTGRGGNEVVRIPKFSFQRRPYSAGKGGQTQRRVGGSPSSFSSSSSLPAVPFLVREGRTTCVVACEGCGRAPGRPRPPRRPPLRVRLAPPFPPSRARTPGNVRRLLRCLLWRVLQHGRMRMDVAMKRLIVRIVSASYLLLLLHTPSSSRSYLQIWSTRILWS